MTLHRAMVLLLAMACAHEPPPPPPVPAPELAVPHPDDATWPELGAPVHVLAVDIPEGFGVHRIAIDPGHGTGTNSGSTTAWCEDEMDGVMRVSRHLARVLNQTGHFEVELLRTDADGPDYPSRKVAAERRGAEVLLSIHSDARGEVGSWSPRPGLQCPRNDAEPGFAILYSREGAPAAVDPREALARALARRSAAAGLLPYDGADYDGIYTVDPDVPGVFVDGRGLFMLRRPAMPSVIIETHHGLHVEEVARWAEPGTLDAFGSAVVAALVDVLATD